ncbi:hypothetical protein BJV82DRAFT_301409 [Fennellomyces sp. T-0311]|nr:hypothetical protein BJV82DRAFT_301409 [Fennellomyces sp. T-0311]
MIFKTLISTSAAIMAFASGIAATMAPNYPQPGTVWTAGKQYTITWADDGNSPSANESWTNFKIDFMTGDNINMVHLTNVASGLDASAISSYTWTAPQVDPYSAIYFLQFTNGEAAWTTRFAIVAQDGDTPAKEPESTQPSGDAIPWGVGKLASGAAAPAASSPAASSPAASSPAPAETNSAPADSNTPAADANAPAAETPKSTVPAAKDKDTEDSGVSAIRASLGTLAVAMVAAGYSLA